MNLRFFAAASAALLAAGVPAGENLFYNSSFELGTYGWDNGMWRTRTRLKAKLPQISVADSSTSVHGKKCFRFTLDPEYEANWPLVSPEVPLKAGQKYTVSFYAKADQETDMAFSMHTNYMANWHTGSGYHSVRIGKEWKRCHFSFVYQPKGFFLRPGCSNHFLLALNPSNKACKNFYFDAVQIEEGDLTDYKPAKPVEYKVELPTLYLVDKNSISADVTAVAYDKAQKVQKNVIATDLERKREVCSVKTLFDLKAFEPQKKTVVFEKLPYGSLRAMAENTAIAGASDFVRIRSNNTVYQPGKFALGIVGYQFGIGTVSNDGKKFTYTRRFSKNEAELTRLSGSIFTKSIGCSNFNQLSPKGRGQFEWDREDLFFEMAKKHNLKVMCAVASQALYLHNNGKITGLVPDWLAKMDRYGHPEGVVRGEWKHVHCVFPPVEVVGELAEAMAKRYKDDMLMFRLFAEANGYMPAATLAEYAKEVYPRIKKAAPDVLINNATPTEDQGIKMSGYFYEFLKAGGGKYCDIFAFHPYSATQDDSPLSAMDGIESFRNSMNFYKVVRPLAELECFYLTTIPTGTYREKENFRAENLARRLLIDAGEGLLFSSPLSFEHVHKYVPAVEHAGDYILQVPDARFAVHNAMGYFLNGADNAKRVRLAGATLCYVFRNHGTSYSTVWNVSGKSDMTLNLPKGVSCRVYDMFGNEIKKVSGKLTMELGREPKIIEWSQNADAAAIHKSGSYVRHEIAAIHGVKCVKGGVGVLFTNTTPKELSGTVRISSEYTGNVKASFAGLKPNVPSMVVIPCQVAANAPAEFPVDAVVMANGKVLGKTLTLRFAPVIKVGSKIQKFAVKDHFFTLQKVGDTLKIKAFLKRDKVTPPAKPHEPWYGDSAEFFLDFAPNGAYNTQKPEKYTLNCVQIVVPALKEGPAKLVAMPDGYSTHGAVGNVKNVPGGAEVELTVPFKGELALTVHCNVAGKTGIWRGKQNFQNRNGFAILVPEK